MTLENHPHCPSEACYLTSCRSSKSRRQQTAAAAATKTLTRNGGGRRRRRRQQPSGEGPCSRSAPTRTVSVTKKKLLMFNKKIILFIKIY
jgi:hypothetical protein